MDRSVLFIGIGQLGCTVADVCAAMMKDKKDTAHVLSVDTDARTEENVVNCDHVSFAQQKKISDVLDFFDTDLLKDWFPCDRENDSVEYFETLSMNDGTAGWRMKALFAFDNYLSNRKNREIFHKKLDNFLQNTPNTPETQIRIITLASLAGGTGSGLLVPLTLYVKNYIRAKTAKNPESIAVVAMPDVCFDLLTEEQKVKAKANAYATIKELNAMHKAASVKDHGVDFKIGAASDPYMGLLYDSKDEKFTDPAYLPFSQIFLYKRTPGVNTVIANAQIIAQSALSMMNEDLPQITNTNGALFGAISSRETRYCKKSLLSYISHRVLFDVLDEKLLSLVNPIQTAVAISKQSGAKGAQRVRSDVDAIVNAVLNMAAKTELAEVKAYEKELSDTIDRNLFKSDHSILDYIKELEITREQQIKEAIALERAMAEELERARAEGEEIPVKKEKFKPQRPKDPLFGAKKRKNELISHIKLCAEFLDEYYFFSVKNANKQRDNTAEAMLEDSKLNTVKRLLMEESGSFVPFTALTRLCALHRDLSAMIEDSKAIYANPLSELSTKWMPKEFLLTNHRVGMDCKYDTCKNDRFQRVIKGHYETIGSSSFDRELFDNDLLYVYRRMRLIFRRDALIRVLESVEKLIKTLIPATLAIRGAADEFAMDTSASEIYHSVPSLHTFYLGTTAMEKRACYDKFKKFAKYETLDDAIGESLWDTFEKNSEKLVTKAILGTVSLAKSEDKTGEFEANIYKTLQDFRKDTEKTVKASSFYSDHIDKNLLEVLLEQNGQNGSLTMELATGMMILDRFDPIVLSVPQNKRDLEIWRRACRRTFVQIPEEIFSYVENNPDKFGGVAPDLYFEDLIFNAGEHTGEPRCDIHLPPDTACVNRRIFGIRPSFLEAFNEDARDHTYFGAYNKALGMKEEQNTELWDPHICLGASSAGSLPFVKDNFDVD